MDRLAQIKLARALERALKAEGIVIEKWVMEGGNLRRWESVPAEAIIGRLMAATGWRIRLGSA